MWTGRVLHWLRAVAQVPFQAHSAGSQRYPRAPVRVSVPVDHHLPIGQSQEDQGSRVLFEVSNRHRRVITRVIELSETDIAFSSVKPYR